MVVCPHFYPFLPFVHRAFNDAISENLAFAGGVYAMPSDTNTVSAYETPPEKPTPKELLLLEIQREKLRGDWEVEKQHAANRGAWIGGGIGALSAIAVAVAAAVMRDKSQEGLGPATSGAPALIAPTGIGATDPRATKSEISSLRTQVDKLQTLLDQAETDRDNSRKEAKSLHQKIKEWQEWGEDQQAQLKAAKASANASPEMSLSSFQWNGTADACRVRVANVAAEDGYKKIPTNEEFAGEYQGYIAIVSCATRTIVVAGRGVTRTNELLYALRKRIGSQ